MRQDTRINRAKEECLRGELGRRTLNLLKGKSHPGMGETIVDDCNVCLLRFLWYFIPTPPVALYLLIGHPAVGAFPHAWWIDAG